MYIAASSIKVRGQAVREILSDSVLQVIVGADGSGLLLRVSKIHS